MQTLQDEADESRTQSVGAKRRLAKSQAEREPERLTSIEGESQQQRLRRNLALFAERHGIDSEERKSILSSSRKKRQHRGPGSKKRRAEKRTLTLTELTPSTSAGVLPSRTANDKATKPAAMESSPRQDHTGAMAWNNASAGTIRTSLRPTASSAAENQFGRNRLATGFTSNAAAAAPSPDSLESGETHSTPIEISSDEEDEEGGMVINVEGQATPELISLDSSEGYEEEEGDDEMEDDEQAVATSSTSSPVFGDPDAHMQLQGELERHLSNDFEPLSIKSASRLKSNIRLGDLSADELEHQYRYCFYGLRRDQIDLSRPAICLECLEEGHTDVSCPEKHCTQCNVESDHSKAQCPSYRRCTKCRERGHDATICQAKLKQTVCCEYCGSSHHVETECTLRFFPSVKTASNAAVRLWISCCNCGSKSHLVGDCRALHPDHAPRWSLRNLDPNQVTNLSLQSGINGLEKAAENRNMRPQGIDIRPAKQRPTVNQIKTFDEDSSDGQASFIRPPVPRQNQKGNINFAQQPPSRDFYPSQRQSPDRESRYDRYDAPTAPNNRSRGDWYSSDSFGQRRRSRSPEQSRREFAGGDSYRPYDQPPPQSQRRSQQYPPPRGRYNREQFDEFRHWQPPLPSGPPPGYGQGQEQSYRPGPGAGLPARPQQQQAYRRQEQRSGYRRIE